MSVPQKPGKKGGAKKTKTTALATSTTSQPTVTSQTVFPDHPPHTTVTMPTSTPAHTIGSMTTTAILPGGASTVTPTIQPVIKVDIWGVATEPLELLIEEMQQIGSYDLIGKMRLGCDLGVNTC